MRKNRLFILGIFTVMVALVSLSLVSGTWAKYTSTVSGEDSANVAKWAFTVSDKSYGYGSTTAFTEKFTFNLFNTIKDTDGSGETDISATDGSIIAPGTQGSFDLVLTNTSQVTAQYSVVFEVTNSQNIPVEFSTDGGTSWGTSLGNIAVSDDTKLAHTSGTDTITVQWRWVFAGDHTALGILGDAAEIKVSAAVTFTQVD